MNRTKISAFLAGALFLSACNSATPTPTVRPLPTAGVTFVPAGTPAPGDAQAVATPRPAGPPVLVDRLPVRGEALDPAKGIELAFDQPMDRASVEKSVVVNTRDDGPVEGAFEWVSDTVVRFTPKSGWDRGAEYSVALAKDARSTKGIGLARAENFAFNTIGSLSVAQTIPADGAQEVAADDTITILFNRPVVPLSGVADQANLPTPVTFDPPIAGQGRWLNTSIYVFTPAAALAAGTTYAGVIAAGLKDTTGAPLETETRFAFTVAPPQVVVIDPAPAASAVKMRERIRLDFSQPMDHASVEQNFVIDPPVRGSFEWVALIPEPPQGPSPLLARDPKLRASSARNGEALIFTPSESYARNTRHTVTVAAGARAANGSVLGKTFTSTFTSVPLPAVISTQPGNETQGAPIDTFQIGFSAPVSPATIIDRLRFSPAISFTDVFSYYDEYNNTFNMSLALRPSTAYRVRVAPGIADDFGAVISEVVDLRFTTAALVPFVAFAGDAQVGFYSAARPTTVFASYRNVTEIELSLVKLTTQQFADFVISNNSYEKLQTFKPAEDALLRTWKLQARGQLNQSVRERISLDAAGGALEPGMYLFTASAPEIKALDPTAPPTRQIMVVTSRHVAMKYTDAETLAWVTDLTSGAPVGNALIKVYTPSLDPLGSGETTAGGEQAGQALISTTVVPTDNQNRLMVVDEDGPGFGLVWTGSAYGLTPYDFDLPVDSGGRKYFAYLYSDRPIYRPGQMVFVKGIVRRDEDARYSIDPALNQTPPRFELYTSQGQTLYTGTVQLSASGAFSTAFVLDNSVPSGPYSLKLCIGADAVRCEATFLEFNVSAYRRPEYEVDVALDKPEYLSGESIKATLRSRYYFGGAVSNADVTWTLSTENWQFDRYSGQNAGPGRYQFGDYDYRPYFDEFSFEDFPRQIANGMGKTNAEGMLEITVPADLSKDANSARYTLEVSVTDPNKQSVAGRNSAIVHKGAFYTGVAVRNYVGSTGEEQAVDLITVDWSGKPVADKVIDVAFARREWFTTQNQDQSGSLEYASTPSDTVVLSQTVTSDAEGKATASFVPEQGGTYRAIATGRGAGASVETLWVSSEAYVAWRVDNHDRITLTADKALYKPGEVARVLVPSPFQGPVTALLTIERGRVIERRTIALGSNSTVLEIPIDASFAPNAFVSVLLVKAASAADQTPDFKLGYTAFGVDPGAFALKVKVTPEKSQLGPRDTAVYDIEVTDAQGQPVEAELSVALVDKAVLSLRAPNSALPLDAFYGRRGLAVRTDDSLSLNIDRVNKALERSLSSKGGGGGGGPDASTAFVRNGFKDTAYWDAVVNTDPAGKARVSVRLPDNLTTWAFDARAVTADGKAGQGLNEIVSTKPLLIRPVTPRFFVTGDAVTLGAVINNTGDSALETEVILEGSGVVFKSDTVLKASVPAKGVVRVNWQVQAVEAASAQLTFTVKSGALIDSSTPTLASAPDGGIPIVNYVSPETVATAGDIAESGAKLEIVALPQRLDSGRGALDVRVSTSLADAADKALDALTVGGNSLEDTEYTSSLLLARLGVAGPGGVNTANLPELQRLFAIQRSEGGWGWYVNSDSDPFITAHALIAIARAREAGAVYDESSISRAREYLMQLLSGASGTIDDTTQANRTAYVLYALGETGQPDAGRLATLYEQRAKLSHFGRAVLALAFERATPGAAQIKTLLADLQGAAIASAAGAHWEDNARDYANFYGATRSTSVVLYALAKLDAKNPQLPNVVRWLMSMRDGDAWRTAHEIGWALQALGEWRRVSADADPDYAWRVALNDNTVVQGDAKTASGPGPVRSDVQVPVAQLLRGQGNQLAFERGDGRGRLYYNAIVRTYLPVEEAKALDRGIAILRKYERADCAPTPEKPCEAINGAKVGDLIRVRLTVLPQEETNYLRVTDMLPAGAEVVDTSLRTNVTLADGLPVNPVFGDARGWGWWWFSNTDIRDDRVVLSAYYTPAGALEYTYVIRASIAGQFKVIPASAELANFPDVFGRTEGAVFAIAE
jgi:alpha-2-macroglobulin